MKHLFFVLSPVTCISAAGVIEHLSINEDDVLFVNTNLSTYNTLFKTINYNITNEKVNFLVRPRRSYNLYKNPAHYLNEIIDGFVGDDDFQLYVSWFTKTARYALIHPKCKGFHFIEEGLMAYYDNFSLNQYTEHGGKEWNYEKGLRGIRQRINASRDAFFRKTEKVGAIPLYFTTYSGDKNVVCYGLSDKAFARAVNRVTLNIKKIGESYLRDGNILSLNNACIWIGDVDEMQKLGKDEYYSVLKKYLFSLIGERELYVRFHPRDSKQNRDTFIDFIKKNGVKYRLIENSQVMEFVYIASHNCTSISLVSSLLIYSSILGHESISLAKLFPGYYESLQKAAPLYSTFVKYLEPTE